MLHIAICDDENDFVANLTALLEQYAAERSEEIKVTAYYDGMELIERYDPSIDLIFLDIQMRLMDGLQAAEHIRRVDETVGILFLTPMTQYGLEGYKFMASILFSAYFSLPYISQRVSAYADKAAAMTKVEMFPQICELRCQN